ncbi:N-acetylglucosamine-6-phosphate deacetylase [Endozoicomonas lisbonensis]|uniref:N-acetylgalactosamine-6-phosphate deacetylase n=1 Tax=Endozoicomonas lisbonensis TaxID=3120522 RepID=A0ABV2SAT8_9GAMM
MGNSFHLFAGELFTEDRVLTDSWLEVTDGVITGISSEKGALDAPVIDLGHSRVIPGLIDLHIHGCGGHDVMDDNPETIPAISTLLASRGVTGFLSTTATAEWQETLACLQRLGEQVNRPQPGAELLGIYSEGIFFTDRNKGAHDSRLFLAPVRERLEAMIRASGNTLRQVALAPELPEAGAAIAFLRQQGVKVSMGHTDATYDQAMAAIKQGAGCGVHLFNGMKGLHHREPGCTGAVLTSAGVLAELIADGIHVHPAVLSLVVSIKGREQTALISDCTCAGMMPDGDYALGSMAFKVVDGIARTREGSLAGSTLSLNTAVANMIELAGVSPLDAVHMASLTPATYLGIDKKTGSIHPGKRANIAATGKDFSVSSTWVDGHLVYQR